MQYSRIIGLDYGEVRIGIAFSDLLQVISSPYETYKRKELNQDLSYLTKLIKEKEVSLIVLGLPLNMDGTEGDRAIKTREFGALLSKATGLEIVYIDERLTSLEAEEMLIEAKVRREKRKQLIDQIAAQIILETYLKSKK